MKKKLLSVLLATLMILSMFAVLPMTASAAGGMSSSGWFSYCGDDATYSSAIGASGEPLTWAIKIPAANLPQENTLSVVSYYVDDATNYGTYHIRIYSVTAGTNPNVSTPSYEQEFVLPNPVPTGWQNIVLTTPFAVDKTKDLWIGIGSEDIFNPASCATQILENTDCCMIYYNGWNAVSNLGSSFQNHPWMIRGYFGILPVELPYSFDFETKPFDNGWTSIDADDDGYDWITGTNYAWDADPGLGIDGGHCAMSQSYVNYAGALNANNWLFSPAITIPAGGAIVSWYEKSQDSNWPDSYTVYASETNTSTDPSGMTVICAEHEAAGGPDAVTQTIETWTQKTVELSAKDYAGKTVYIAFQHQDRDSFYLKIDNFAVEALYSITNDLPQADAETNHGYLDVDEITGVITVVPNEGYQLKADSLKVYKTGDTSTTVSVTLGQNDTYTFTMPAYNVSVTAEFELSHVHTGSKQNGRPASEESAGWNDYYACDCGLYFEDETCITLIGDEAALTEWKANAGARPQLSHEYDANHRCKNCHDIDPTYQLSREDALALVKGVYKSGSDTFDFASTSDAVAKNGDTLYTVNELKFYRIDNTIYVIYGGSSHAKMATFTLNGDNKVTSVSIYDMMTEETTGTYAPEHTHKGVKQNGQAATEDAAGWKDYYTCDCGLYFEDEACETEIGDESALATWKTGKGAIQKLPHSHKGTKQNGQAATEDAAGFHDYYYCEGCDTYFEDENCTKTIGGAAALTTWKSEGTGYIAPTGGGNDPKDPDPKDDDDDKGGLSTGAIVGIVIGAVVVVGAAGFLIWFFLFFKKKNDDDDEPTDPNGDTPNDDTPNGDATNGGENE